MPATHQDSVLGEDGCGDVTYDQYPEAAQINPASIALPIPRWKTHNGDGPGGVAQRQSGPQGKVASSNLATPGSVLFRL